MAHPMMGAPLLLQFARTKKSVHLTMITPNGVAESPERHFIQSELTLDDLFHDA
jgi:hypothetical protein